MIAYLKGILAEKEPSRVVIECGGVGYECAISLTTYEHLPATDGAVKLFTHHEVREDAQLLFGFATEPERDMFRTMIGVSGVGPKLALSVLSGLSLGDLQLAIAQGDAKRLATIKGVGKKTAERLVVELKDKVNPIEALAHSSAAATKEQGGVLRDAMLALTALGFAEDAAREMVERVLEADPKVDNVETVIRQALKSR